MTERYQEKRIPLPNGAYRTAHGSLVEISGRYGGISRVEFNWFDEGACIDCHVRHYEYDGQLVWDCDVCGGGSADLFPIPGSGCEGCADE